MPRELLQMKLYVPRIRPSLVSRPHLIEKLNQGLQQGCKLTLISAPAGFGKTTLIAEWGMRISELSSSATEFQNQKLCWLSLDEGDANLSRFLTYFIAALQKALPTVGENVMAALQSPQPPSAESTLTAILNEIAIIQDNLIIVLDDYHLVDALPVDRALTFLLDHLPPKMHLVITTREDPQLPLPRLRVRGQLTELRSADLRFTYDEATTFLNRVMKLKLSVDDVVSLESRIEGWIAGLQLAALALQGHHSIHGHERSSEFIKSLAGDNRYIIDYLVEEVLQHQPDHVRSFLLQTSILNRLNGPLCDAVTGKSTSSELLETLERSNLFIVSLDDKRHWYRYHHLFADVLYVRLMRREPDEVPGLHRRASEWYEQNGLPSDAIHHALIIEDFERAAALIEMVWPAILNGIQPNTWRNWVLALPEELVRVRPVLNVGCAWTFLDDGELEKADTCLRTAERLLEVPPDNLNAQPKSLLAQTDHLGKPNKGAELSRRMVIVNKEAFQTLPASIASARAYLSQIEGDVSTAISNALLALSLFPEDEHYQRGIVAMFLGLANWTGGNLAAASQSIIDSISNMEQVNNIYFQVVGWVMLADLKAAQGHLREAGSAYEQSMQIAKGESAFTHQGTADQYVGISQLYLEWDDLEAAKQHLLKGKKELADQAILPGSESRWYTAMARVKVAEGNLVDALDLLHIAERRYQRDPIPDVRPAAALMARIWIEQGRLADALNWAHERRPSVSDEPSYLHEFEHITLARIFVAQYKRDKGDDIIPKAISLLERLLQAAEAGGRMQSILEILVLQAVAYQEQGDMSKALATIKHALTLAEPEGYIRLFVDEGQPMRTLLAASLAQGTAPVYVKRLLQAIEPHTDDESARPDPNQLLIEPLSNRELEVLGLLANGLSNQEIADELVIALSTVKKHVNNIFGKLNVASRTQAVNRARDLNIL